MAELLEVQSAKDAESRKPKILTIGPIGVGKTTQFLTLPGKKFSYAFDPNAVDSLVGHDVDYIEFIPDTDELDLSVKPLKTTGGIKADRSAREKMRKRTEPKVYMAFEEDFERRCDDGFFDQYDYLSFDGCTSLSEIVMDRVQYLNNRLGKHPEQADWTSEMNTFRNIIRKALRLKCGLYLTAHTEIMKDENTKLTYAQLVITGRNRIRVPMRFSQIYALEVEPQGKAKPPEYVAHTVPDKMHPGLRSTVKNLAPIEDVTLDWSKNLVGQGLGKIVTRQKEER